jgi:hypothetical protein
MLTAHPRMSPANRSSFLHRYLDPTDSLGEVMFGLIMTLTFTLGAGIMIEDEGRKGARELLMAAIGCNIAWGLIDAAQYIVGRLYDRGRLRRLGGSIRRAPPAEAIQLVAGELDELLAGVTSDAERAALYQRVAETVRAKPVVANAVTKDDLLGAATSFWLVVLSSVPAAVPFLLVDDARLALRMSNGILLALLFCTGYAWARHTLSNPWIVGLAFLLGGGALVATAIALGG